MSDGLMLLIVILFFAATFGLLSLCGRLMEK